MSDEIRAFIYARKSTEAEDRQVYSIEHQIKELRELAAKHNIHVVKEFEEAKTAKVPGRPFFNEMIQRVKKGEASCILSWHPDRLARNGPDGSAITHLIDTRQLADLKFASFWFEPTPQGMLMLSIAFGMSKYYVDAMSQGIKRAYNRRLQDGHWPHRPPIGYGFDRNTRTVVLDPVRAPLVRQAFQTYAAGDCTLRELTQTMHDLGLRSVPTKKQPSVPLVCGRIYAMLQNPFYVGTLRFNGEVYEGRHEPIISIAVFDHCQTMLAQRGRKNPKDLKPFLYRRMFRCDGCGSLITSETKKGHVYLRCPKRPHACSQPYLREEVVTKQIAGIIGKIVAPPDAIRDLVTGLAARENERSASVAVEIKQLKANLDKFDAKLRRLTDAYVEDALSVMDFRKDKEKVIRSKRELNEKLTFIEGNRKNLFEPAKRFFQGLTEPRRVIESGDPAQQKEFFKKSFSNFRLKGERIMCESRGPWKHVAGQRFLDKPEPAVVEPVASTVVPQGFCLERCGAPSGNRTAAVLDAVCHFFTDNPNWA
jgi:site-specific DNA recombinase